jgi:hypothetical protein
MSDGTKRNSDKLNTIGIVVVGICGAVLAYVSIALLQAFYMNDSSDVQTMADYGGQDTEFQRIRAEEFSRITQCTNVMAAMGGGGENKHTVPVDHAMRLVVDDARRDAAMLVPLFGRADKPTIKAQFDRPVPLTAPAPADPALAPAPGTPVPADGSTTAPADGSTTAPAATSGAVAPAPTGGTLPSGAASPPAPVSPAPPAPVPSK